MIPPVLDRLPPVAAHAPAPTAATAEAEAEAAQPVAADNGVVLAQDEPLNPVIVAEHVRQSRLARWQAQRS